MKIENYDDRYFKLNNLPYRKKDYVATFKNVNTTGSSNESLDLNMSVIITNKFTGESILGEGLKVRDFQNSLGANYSSLATFLTDLEVILDDNTNSSIGPTGPTGPQGAAGPAGLYWKGAWVSGTSYTENDAVGDDGASYFCILATSGTTAPSLNTTNWALLASQGAVGPTGATGATGATGPQGIQGPQGLSVASSYRVYTAILSQSGTNNPVAIILENTLGITPTWTRLSTGSYQFNAPGTLTSERTILFTQLNNNQNTLTSLVYWLDFLRIQKQPTTEGVPVSDGLDSFVEIRVYN